MTESEFIALEGNVNKGWKSYFQTNVDYSKGLYKFKKNKAGQFTDYTTGAMGRMQPWQGTVAYDQFKYGYSKQYRAYKYSTGIQIPKDMFDDSEYDNITTEVNRIAEGVLNTINFDSAKPFNDAWTASVLGADGATLASAAHHLVPGDDAQSNTSTAYSPNYADIESIRRIMRHWKNDRGDDMLVDGNMIIAGDYWEDTLKKLFGSDKEAFSADNTDNVYKGFSFMIHPLITGKTWAVVNKNTMLGGQGLNWFMKKDPRNIERDGAVAAGDFNSEQISWKSVGRWDLGWTVWHFGYFCNPA